MISGNKAVYCVIGAGPCGLTASKNLLQRNIPFDCLEREQAEVRAQALPARRGESILVHNHTWHRTGQNHTAAPRRAVSVSFLGAEVSCVRRRRAPRQFLRLFERSTRDA